MSVDAASPGSPAARGFPGRGTLVKWKRLGHTGRRARCFQGSVFGYACSAMVLCVYVSSVFSYETVPSVCMSEPHCTRLCLSPSLHAHLHARGSFPVSEPPCLWPVSGRCCLCGPGQSRVALRWAGCQAGPAGLAALSSHTTADSCTSSVPRLHPQASRPEPSLACRPAVSATSRPRRDRAPSALQVPVHVSSPSQLFPLITLYPV